MSTFRKLAGPEMMQPVVFLSYRRSDASGSAGRLFDLLSQKLPDTQIFMDVEGLEPGIDFPEALDQQLIGCKYFIAVVGPDWASTQDANGRRRLDDPDDYVRLEVETALRRGIRVVPVLVDGATMPLPDELPESLRPFARRNAFVVAHHSFARDVAELANGIRRALGLVPLERDTPVQRHRSPSWTDALLSFRGRLSRKQFWLWTLALLPVTVVFQHLLLMVVGGSYLDFFVRRPEEIPLQHHLIVQVGTLPLWWCAFAIAAKRLHDFNAGGGFTIALVLLTALVLAVDFANVITISGAGRAPVNGIGVVKGTAAGLYLLYLGLWVAVGLVPGTPGQNRYGPSPATGASSTA